MRGNRGVARRQFVGNVPLKVQAAERAKLVLLAVKAGPGKPTEQ